MKKRYAYIWFRYLLTDWRVIRRPALKSVPFAFSVSDHGRMMITAASRLAQNQGVEVGMRAADAKAVCAGLEVLEDKEDRPLKLLKGLGEWCVRYSPIVAIDEFSKDGLFVDISGCAHIWGGEAKYLKEMVERLKSKGYTTHVAIADTPGAAWAIARYSTIQPLIASGMQVEALLSLPPKALRLSEQVLSKLKRLGFYQIKSFIKMPRSVLRRRFGEEFLSRLGQALGTSDEVLKPIQIQGDYSERLSCLEPIRTRQGIEIAIEKLLDQLCLRLQKDGKGLRLGILTCYRIDNKKVHIQIGTNAASHHVQHLFKLFQLKIEEIRPGLGIELFVMDALKVNDVLPEQESFWTGTRGLNNQGVVQLLDRVAGKVGGNAIHRYVATEHYWPERSFKQVGTISEKALSVWRTDKPRPTELLKEPEPIDVMSIIPDYPPKFFVYKGIRHLIAKADGPERIEREWWLEQGQYRDYYRVEDEHGQRYWLFRAGHHASIEGAQWFIHGFFA